LFFFRFTDWWNHERIRDCIEGARVWLDGTVGEVQTSVESH
jgi:hypothetical protein